MDEYKAFLLGEISAVRRREPSPRAFSEAVQILDTIAQAATAPRRSGSSARFQEFVRKYMPSGYRDFRYANGKQDLPEQMYAILRCGLVHSRSLTPNLPPSGKVPVGRPNSILIDRGGMHLAAVRDAHFDAVLFVFDHFVADIEASVRRVFLEAATDSGLGLHLARYMRANPPARGLLSPISYIDPAAPLGSTRTATASGSVF